MRIAKRKSDPGGAASTKPFRSVGFMLSTLGYAVSRRFHEVLAPLDLEPSQFSVLRAVGFSEGASQQALAERLHISASHMVAVVDGLEKRGLLERQPHPGDRRVHSLHLTSDGENLLAKAFELAKQFEQRLTTPLSAGERKELLDLLDRVAEAMELRPGAHAALQEDR